MLYADQENGVIMSTQSLVLQRVSRAAVGDYVCRYRVSHLLANLG